MPMRYLKDILYLICPVVLLAQLLGCSALQLDPVVDPPRLVPSEETKVGEAVAEKLIQILGGPYHDKILVDDLNHLSRQIKYGSHPLKITVADRSKVAFYPLPGGRVILTRGLLSEITDRIELDALLTYAASLSSEAYDGRTTRSMLAATQEILSTPPAPYDPESAPIRLARQFAKLSCDQDCLATVQKDVTVRSGGTSVLPATIKRISNLQPGYELAAKARKLEKSGEQAQAVANYLRAAVETPDEPRILSALGLAYMRAGQLQAARLHLEKAAQLQPDYYRTQMGLGYLYLKQGKLSQAKQVLSNSVQMLPVTENLFLLAEVKEKSGDLKGARLLYQKIVETDRSSKLGRTSARRLTQLTSERAAGVQ